MNHCYGESAPCAVERPRNPGCQATPITDACDTLLATLAPTPADDIALLLARTTETAH
jgi:hypothetical protein